MSECHAAVVALATALGLTIAALVKLASIVHGLKADEERRASRKGRARSGDDDEE
jgi:hypothetical protein